MKTKDLTQQLNGLLGQSMQSGGYQPAYGPVSGNFHDDIPDELENDPLFEINYKSEQKQAIKKAKDSIMLLVKDIVPTSMQKSPLILDKINQDAEQLGNLYYQYRKKETYHQALMETIACGQTEAKRFEVAEKISTSLEDLGQKITDLQNNLRKYYIDTYLDMQQKDEMEMQDRPAALAASAPEKPAIMDNVMTGTDSTTKILAEKKRRALMAKYQQADD